MNTQIEITENGKTTLHTAGKYCDRNIDVNTSVPTFEEELEEEKAFSLSLLTRTVTAVNSNALTTAEHYIFYNCTQLRTVIIPNVTSINNYSFFQCYNLGNGGTLDFSSVTSIGTQAFAWCSQLVTVDFPKLQTIAAQAFRGCGKLRTVIMRGGAVVTLANTNAFDSSATVFYVPDSLVDSYKTATNWSTWADRIKPISELGE